MIGPLTYVPRDPSLADGVVLLAVAACYLGLLVWLIVRIARG